MRAAVASVLVLVLVPGIADAVAPGEPEPWGPIASLGLPVHLNAYKVAWRPDGSSALVVSGRAADPSTGAVAQARVYSYDARSETLTAIYDAAGAQAVDVAWDHEGRYALVATTSHPILKFDPRTRTLADVWDAGSWIGDPALATFAGARVAFHPSGVAYLSGSALLRLDGDRIEAVAARSERLFRAIAWHPGGEYGLVSIAERDADGLVVPGRIYRIAAATHALSFVATYGSDPHRSEVHGFAFDAENDRFLAFGNDGGRGTILAIDSSGQSLPAFADSSFPMLRDLEFGPDGRSAIAVGGFGNEILRRDGDRFVPADTPAFSHRATLLYDAAWSPEGEKVIVAGFGGILFASELGETSEAQGLSVALAASAGLVGIPLVAALWVGARRRGVAIAGLVLALVAPVVAPALASPPRPQAALEGVAAAFPLPAVPGVTIGRVGASPRVAGEQAAADAMAYEMRWLYMNEPVQHDTLGTVLEPDGQSTAALGVPLYNCVYSYGRNVDFCPQRDPYAWWDIAPGCTNPLSGQRQMNGECGLRTVGVAGLGRGRFGVVQEAAEHRRLDFFDMRFFQGAKIEPEFRPITLDLGLGGAAGAGIFNAWFGTFHDRNGNGVVDDLGQSSPATSPNPRNEFKWAGDQCGADEGVRHRGECRNVNQNMTRYAYLTECVDWHWHAGGWLGSGSYHCHRYEQRVVEYKTYEGGPLSVDVWTIPPSNPASTDLRVPHPIPDFTLSDHSGESDNLRRGWFQRAGASPILHYDDSVLTTLTTVAIVHVVDRFDWDGGIRYVDVDHYVTAGGWDGVFTGFAYPTVANLADFASDRVSTLNEEAAQPCSSRSLDVSDRDACGTAVALAHHGFSHEPNTPNDAYPGARYLAVGCPDDAWMRHRGACNDYTGYATPRLFADAQFFVPAAWTASGALASHTFAPPADGNVLAPGNPALPPGLVAFRARVGLWQDLPHTVVEERLNLTTLAPERSTYALPADGWIGNVVETTGTWESKGYNNSLDAERCQIPRLAPDERHPYAWCHPDLDGAIVDGNGYAPLAAEPQPAPPEFASAAGRVANTLILEITPEPTPNDPREGPYFDRPTILIRDYRTAPIDRLRSDDVDLRLNGVFGVIDGVVGVFEDWTGRSGVIKLRLELVDPATGLYESRDALFTNDDLARSPALFTTLDAIDEATLDLVETDPRRGRALFTTLDAIDEATLDAVVDFDRYDPATP